jgi:hypothetical protein
MAHFISTLKKSKPLNTRHLFTLACCMLGSVLFAAQEKGTSRLKFASYNATTNKSIFLEDNKMGAIYTNLNTPATLGFFDQSCKNRLVLGVDKTIIALGAINSLLTNNVYRAEVDVQIIYNELTLQSGVFVMNNITLTKTLKVSFSGFNAHTASGAPTNEVDLDAFTFNNGYQCLVNITAVRVYNSYSATSPIVTTNVPANMYLELESDVERYYDINTTAATPYAVSNAVVMQYFTGSTSGNEVEVRWQRVAGAEEYDLEWLWLDEFTYGNGTGGTSPANPSWGNFPELNFKTNSTRIRTDQNFYRISNIYESGHLFCRVPWLPWVTLPLAIIIVIGLGPI